MADATASIIRNSSSLALSFAIDENVNDYRSCWLSGGTCMILDVHYDEGFYS